MLYRIIIVAALSVTIACAADVAAPPAQPPATPSTDELFEAGKELFEQYAPESIKDQYEFPSKAEWDAFAARLQGALDRNDLAELAKYEGEARAALTALRILPGYEGYADWLQERLDYIEAAKAAAKRPLPELPPVTSPTPKVSPTHADIPYYDLWLSRIRTRARPAAADELMPTLLAAFAAEGVPPELAWLAEAESTLDPSARSPSGAKGLFQLMPVTAKALGLSTFMPDERTDVEKSARAAAKYLRTLYSKFGSWPLALAAYNAGEGKVRRLLAAKNAKSFAEVSAALPSETRMYVPKVCATIAVRAGLTPDKLGAPRSAETSNSKLQTSMNQQLAKYRTGPRPFLEFSFN
jgi:membrane-bound lytic murein transglycosylase D